MNSRRLRSQSKIRPSVETVRMVLNDLETVIKETGWWWPNSEVLGMRSTVLAEDEEEMVQIEMTQSMPAVMRVRESTNAAADI